MGDWPQLEEAQRFVDCGAVTGSSTGTTVTGSGTNTKASWVQLIASTAFDCSALGFLVSAVASMATLLDIGIGGAGSEQVLVPNLYAAAGTGASCPMEWLVLPIVIPAGTRIAARVQSSGSAGSPTCLVWLIA